MPSTNDYGGSLSRRLTEDSELEANDANFIGALALYQNRRDAAIGLHHITAKQRGLIWHYNRLRQAQAKEYLLAASQYGALREIEKRIKALLKEARAKGTPIERKRELLIQALELQETAKQWQPTFNM